MANIKISELTALTPPDAADLVPVTDSSASQTKRTTVGEIVGIINGDVDVANDGTATISELPVSKLQDGAARQLLQTAANGLDVEWTSNIDVPGTLDVTGATTLDAALNVAGLASLDGGIDVDGAFTVANTSGNIATSGTLDVDGEATLASAIIEDLTNNRVLIAGTGGAVEDNANLTFNGTTFDVGSGNLQITAANGNTSIAGTLGVDGQSTLASAAVSDLTSGRVVLAGTSGELEDNAGLTFNGTQLDVDGDVVITGDLTVEGASTVLETETVKVEDKNIELGVVGTPTDVTADGGGITLKGTTDKTINWVDATDSWTSSEHVDLASGKSYRINGTEVLSATALGSAVQISSANIPNGTIVDADVNASAEIAVSKLADGDARQLLQTDAAGTGVEWTSNVDVPGTLDVTGATTLDSTLGVDGQSTLASAAVSDLTSGRVVLAGTSGELEDSAGLTFDGTQLDVDGDLVVAGSLVFEGSTADDFETTLAVTDPTADRTITLPDVSGTVVTTGDTGTVTSTMIDDNTIVDANINPSAEIAVSKLANGTANQVLVTDGTDVSWSDDLTIAGNLTVNGTATTVNTETLVVEDKNIELGVVASPTDVTADGGGITLKGTTDKTINWVDATDAWTFSEHVDIASAKEYRIAGTKVLDATSLGSAVVTSSLTSVGTISSGTWQGTAIDAAYLDSTVVTTGDTGTVTSTMIDDNTIVDADINASAAIAGTKIAPDFGSQNVTTTGNATAAALIPSGSTAPSNGIYLPDANNVALSVNGSEGARLTTTGLGIGTSSPGALFHAVNTSAGAATLGAFIQNAGSTANTEVRLGFSPNSNPVSANRYAYIGAINVLGSTDNSLTFGTGSGAPATERMRIDSSGNVGIGTTSPGSPLEVAGTGSEVVRFRGNGANGGWAAWNSGGTNYGYIGPAALLASGTSTQFTIRSENELLFASVGGSERARIDISGRLLVGTSSDSGGALLQVNDNRIRVATAKTPASASDTGTTGEICWDASYVYVCTATNTWKRAALSTW